MSAAGSSQPPAAEPAPAQERKGRPGSLHDAVMGMEPVTDRILRWMPEWVRSVMQDRRRQLLYMERQMQRRLINEFRAQARELEPILHTRGRMLGEVIIETFTGEDETTTTYGEVAASSLEKTGVVELKMPVKELAATIDPLITPFIDPFVEGLKSPINEKVREIKKDVVHSFAATGAACLLAGFLLGRYLPRGGDGGGGRGGR